MEKVLEILKSWWINSAATGLLGVLLLSYGYKLYAGLALGWAACATIDKLKSMATPKK